MNERALLQLIENNLKAGDTQRAGVYADILLKLFDMEAIRKQLKSLSNNYLIPPISSELISQYIESRLKKKARPLIEIQN